MDIIRRIDSDAQNIEKSDIDSLVNDLVSFYQSRIRQLAGQAYGSILNSDDGPSVAVRAFEEQAKHELKRGLETFLFSVKHWESRRSIGPYLLTCLSRLADRIKYDLSGKRKLSTPICPACKVLGNREFLIYENKFLRCQVCTHEADTLENQIDISDDKYRVKLESKLRLRKIFSLHSRKGFRCPECERFIPASYISQYGVSCVYDDCTFFGTTNELDFMSHPTGLRLDNILSINQPVYYSENGKDLYISDSIDAKEINADAIMNVVEQYQTEKDALLEVIKNQEDRLYRTESPNKARLKLLMLQAFKNKLATDTEDMVAYLARGKHFSEHPIQSRIFQEYIRLVENNLPFILTKGGRNYEIYTLKDPMLNLFLGESEFEAEVGQSYLIPNMTVETYTGSGRQKKEFGRCFIGYLTDVIDIKTNESIMDNVLGYTFVDVRVSECVAPGTLVKVRHLRIPAHYEMLGLVNLQRTRRRLVDSVYLKLHGKERVTKNAQD